MKLLLLLATAVSLSLVQGTLAKSSEDRLVSDLLTGFLPVGRIARPVPASGGNVSVSVGASLVRLGRPKDITELEFAVWIKTSWNDSRLTWNASDYGGVKSVSLPYDSVWQADLRPYNTLTYKPDTETASRVVVSSKGAMINVLPASMVTRCRVTRANVFTCKLKLGSWVHSTEEVDLQLWEDSPFDVTDFQDGDLWKVLKTEALRQEKTYPCCPESYVTINYTLEVQWRGNNQVVEP